MSITLTYGNTPPSRSRIVLGEQVRNDDQLSLIRLNHEFWANAGETLGGLIYDRAPWTTTSTTFGAGLGWALDQWQPIVNFEWRLTTLTGSTSSLRLGAYVRNCDIRILFYDTNYSLLATGTAFLCTDNTPQWVTGIQGMTGLSGSGTRICVLQARRSTFAADGALYHFGAKAGPSSATEIPT